MTAIVAPTAVPAMIPVLGRLSCTPTNAVCMAVLSEVVGISLPKLFVLLLMQPLVVKVEVPKVES